MEQDVEQLREKFSNQSSWTRLISVVLWFIFFPPSGLFYFWKNIQFLSKKLHVLLWIFGGWNTCVSFYFLFSWLPNFSRILKNIEVVMPNFLYLIAIFFLIIAICEIILGVIIFGKNNSDQKLSKRYHFIVWIMLLLSQLIVPIILLAGYAFANQAIYQQLMEI